MGKKVFLASILGALLISVFFVPNMVLAELDEEVLGDNVAQSIRVDTGTGFLGIPVDRGTSEGLGKLKNPIKFESLGQLVNAIIDIIVQIAVPIAALFLIYSGYLFVSARGSDDDLKKAKSIFLWTLVGIAVLLGAKVLASVIQGTIDQIKR